MKNDIKFRVELKLYNILKISRIYKIKTLIYIINFSLGFITYIK